MLENKKTAINKWLVLALVIVPIWSSVISTIHVITFFTLTNINWMAIAGALVFELAALTSLASLVVIDKINKNVVYCMFVILSLYQMMGNAYHAFDYISNNLKTNPYFINNFIDLFGLQDSELPFVKRLLAIISGIFFPVISLGFLDILFNYVMVSFGLKEPKSKKILPTKSEPVIEAPVNNDAVNDIVNDAVTDAVTDIQDNIDSVIDAVNEPASDGVNNSEKVKKQHEEFQQFKQEVADKIKNMRDPYSLLLTIFFNHGTIKKGNELPSYVDFLKMVDLERYPQKEVNQFISLCNYLKVFDVDHTKKIALMDLAEAKIVLDNYFSLPANN